MSQPKGILYVVATPIGNLDDITARALEVLRLADLVAAEDTRHSGRLLSHFGIRTPLTALHEHNERAAVPELIALLTQGRKVALVSDAGTPLLSDPGFVLVREAHCQGIRVSPIPGPSAVTAALSAAGLPTDRFVFEGFLPPRPAARQARLAALATEPRTLVLFEAPHRMARTLDDLVQGFGDSREAVLARELTKVFETIRRGTLAELAAYWSQPGSPPGSPPGEHQRGECVVLVQGASTEGAVQSESERVLRLLLQELPVRTAARLAAQITGGHKNRLYHLALELHDRS